MPTRARTRAAGLDQRLGAAATNAVGSRQDAGTGVVIAVRGDFWHRCAAYRLPADALKKGPFVVGPMTGSELRLAITGPAEAVAVEIDPGLTDTILRDPQWRREARRRQCCRCCRRQCRSPGGEA